MKECHYGNNLSILVADPFVCSFSSKNVVPHLTHIFFTQLIYNVSTVFLRKHECDLPVKFIGRLCYLLSCLIKVCSNFFFSSVGQINNRSFRHSLIGEVTMPGMTRFSCFKECSKCPLDRSPMNDAIPKLIGVEKITPKIA